MPHTKPIRRTCLIRAACLAGSLNSRLKKHGIKPAQHESVSREGSLVKDAYIILHTCSPAESVPSLSSMASSDFSGGETVKSRVTRPRPHANGTRSEGLRDLQAAQIMLQHCNMHPIRLHESKRDGKGGSFTARAVCRRPPHPACDADAAV